MKFNKLLICVLISCVSGACSDWLSVSPEEHVNEKDLFAEADGFKVALNGIYRKMGETSMYGKEMSFGAVEVLGRSYLAHKLKPAYEGVYMTDYSSDEVKSIFQGIWSSAYNAIANCNNLIANIKDADPKLFPENILEKNLILGEAYALRGFLHFDMLRLFAPSEKADDGKTYVPYFENYKSTYEPHLTLNAAMEKVKTDLLMAKKLVAPFDTLEAHRVWLETKQRLEGASGGSLSDNIPDDLFFAYRGYRMNYYAIVAALARVYSWEGDLETAANLATEVIEAKNNTIRYFDFVAHSKFSEDHKLRDEIVFALANQKMIDIYKPYIPTGRSKNTDDFIVDKYIFGWDSDEKEDQRFLTFLEKYSSYYYSAKYTPQTGSTMGEDIVPMIRLSEMYYIQAEYLYKSGQRTEGIQTIDKVRNKRGILSTSVGDEVMDETSFEEQLVLDLHKDLLLEGQAFFWYKKFDLKFSGKTNFVVPTPDNENIN